MKQPRITSYDFFRGILVLGMIAYHTLVNFYNIHINQYVSLYRIPIGFVFFSGIIAGQFLLEKTKKKQSIAIKLLAIYMITNIVILVIREENRYDIITTIISGTQNNASFEILLPIAITIIVGTAWAQKTFQSTTKTLGAIMIIISAILLLDQQGIYIFSLNLSLYGLLGAIR